MVFAAIGFYLWKRDLQERKIRKLSLTIKPDSKKMIQLVVEPLEEARWALKEGKSQLFYNEINKAIWKKISEKIFIPSTELNKHNAVLRLQQKGLPSELLQYLEDVLYECEIALYTPVHTYSDMQQTFKKTEGLLTALDRELG